MRTDYERMEKAILFLEEHALERPSLEEVAREIGLSPFHFQRIFTRWAGISPKRFVQALAVQSAKRALRDRKSLLDASWETGLSSPGRLHDLFVTTEAVTPGEFKTEGAGLTITYGTHPSPFGPCLISNTERGICGLAFVDPSRRQAELRRLRRSWRRATFREDPRLTRPYADRLFDVAARRAAPLSVLLRGTNFQIQVWRALLAIPPGSVTTYGEIAARIRSPRSARAVGTAVGANLVSWLIPCHRVIRKTGAVGGYRWGPARKRVMLAWEAAQTTPPDAQYASR